MKVLKYLGALAMAFFALQACDTESASIGVIPENDEISSQTANYVISSRSVLMDSVHANSTVSYLGLITDPETDTDISADFITQFFVQENFSFPPQESLLGRASVTDTEDTRGVIQCDSMIAALYFQEYYGSDNTPIKIEVYELSKDNIPSEDETYYTNLDLEQFVADPSNPLASRVVTAKDYASDATSDDYRYIGMELNRDRGTALMRQYYENPSLFKDSYTFIRNVFPGLYFKGTNGRGAMLSIFVSRVIVYYHYKGTDSNGNDTIYTGVAQFAGTPEVIQSSRFQTTNLQELCDITDYTYLKTPAGIATELTLPVDEVFANSHENDSISLASVTLTRYNNEQSSTQLGTPSALLMVRKADYDSFFRNKEIADSRTSYITSFSSTYNTYTFSNIGRLLSYCRREKEKEAKKQGISEAEWVANNPDWNKVLLVPVTASYNSSGSLISVTHDMGLNSVRLVGGSTPINMQVVYSKFAE